MTEAKNKTVIKIVVSAMCALLALLIVALIINSVRLSAAKTRRDELAAKSAELDAMIEQGNINIANSNTTEAIVDYARSYLDMVYRDEIIIEVK